MVSRSVKLGEKERKVIPVVDLTPDNQRGNVPGDRYRGFSFTGRKREAVHPLRLTVHEKRFEISPGAGLRVDVSRDRLSGCPSNQIAFVDGVLRRAGLTPRYYRVAPLLRRIPACLRALKVDSLSGALVEIDRSPERLLQAINALLIGTTSFFRDRQVFVELNERVLPDLLRRGSRPRVWSAACSDGAELYSVAMMLDQQGASDPVCLGTDCRRSAVARAREGKYPVSATEEMSSELMNQYFHLTGSTATVVEGIRRRVSWEQADVMRRPNGLRWDLTLCRNLAIYLEPEPMEFLWKKLAAAIVPGGYLVVGRAEKPQLDGFVCVAPCIYQRNPLTAIP